MFFRKKKFIPYGKHFIDKNDINAVSRALKSEFITQGPIVELFEKSISNKVNAKYSIAVNSATSALHLACLALDIKKDDILWTSAITFVASANCGRYCGAKIDFIDINMKDGLIDIEKLKEKLEIAKKKNMLPKILIAVHLGGASCEMETLFSLSQKYKFHIIEDASHAIGGKYKNQNIGNCKFSSITIFSFHPVKIITTGEGGMATTNNKKLADKMYQLRSHGITKKKEEFLNKYLGAWYYEQQDLGFNYRMTDLQSALGKSQLNKLEQIIRKREKIFLKYKNNLNSETVYMQNFPSNVSSAYHLAIIFFKNIKVSQHKKFFEFLRDSSIGVQLHYLPVHLHPYYRNLGFKKGDFPNAEKYSRSVISLPIFPTLKNSEQNFVIKKVKEYIDLFNL